MDGGSSLRMWRTYFPKARVYGIDIHDKKSHDERRIKTFKGSQVDGDFLDRVIDEIGRPDIIIDDGSHINSHIIGSFEHLFPKMKEGGIYAVEDQQTSYWPEHYGGWSTT
ncbi:class I SAM-dependent methyltransferase [Desulfohalovibrio reitneri]|uniref:class I SAM-dependent methyltransferase n=1 Tax=Desulfohalovibrio reitneri TaxID=1307759 RepID=UPI00110E3D7D|nr:class I SAM-dependent methyltransferase [Desulfohalovibrio reitneri]